MPLIRHAAFAAAIIIIFRYLRHAIAFATLPLIFSFHARRHVIVYYAATPSFLFAAIFAIFVMAAPHRRAPDTLLSPIERARQQRAGAQNALRRSSTR
jgi:hypothetical protein